MSEPDIGMRRCYVPKKFGEDAMAIIQEANKIIGQYQAQGFTLTLRQLYYQFVARDLLANQQKNYDRLGAIISDGRLAGLVPWDAVEDRTRNLRGLQYWKSPREAMERIRAGYQIDKWASQPWRPEVWVEKDALIGVIEPICNELGVNYFGCRGYNSQSEQWRAGRRFAHYYQKGQRPIVFHLGDHDPSGIDMTRDNQDRLDLFCGTRVQVVRLALNMPQVEELKPPPNPAKLSDSRAKDYIERFGWNSWELDALEPAYIADLIRKNVLRIRDEKLWNEALTEEASHVDFMDQMMEEMP